MKANQNSVFSGFHPAVILSYFVLVMLTAMFSNNPVYIISALICGMLYHSVLFSVNELLKNLRYDILLFILITLINPVFSHNGVTPLFFMNDNPVTLEAFVYGAQIAGMLLAVIYWCRCFNAVFTNEKLMCLFGRALPKLALLLSMAIGFIPKFKMQIKQISSAQKTMGFYTSKSYADKLRNGIRVFSAMITWSLENSVEAGNSMKARGYGLKGRTSFDIFRFSSRDFITLILIFVLSSAEIISASFSDKFFIYPEITKLDSSITALLGYGCYFMLCIMPLILEGKEAFKWKYYISKI